MRFVFVGSGSLAVLTGRMLAERGHEVILIERDRTVIDSLRDELEVGFIHGDGTRPAILREADPEATHLLFCLTHDDQANIIVSLVAGSLGYVRVVDQDRGPGTGAYLRRAGPCRLPGAQERRCRAESGLELEHCERRRDD